MSLFFCSRLIYIEFILNEKKTGGFDYPSRIYKPQESLFCKKKSHFYKIEQNSDVFTLKITI